MRIHITLGGRVYEDDLAELSAIAQDLDGVNQALQDNPARFSWYATLETLASKAERDARDALAAYEAATLTTLRLATPAVPIGALKAQVRGLPERATLYAAWSHAQDQLALVRVGLKTIEKRKEALRELSANLREQMARGVTPATGTVAERAHQEDARQHQLVRQGRFRKSGPP